MRRIRLCHYRLAKEKFDIISYSKRFKKFQWIKSDKLIKGVSVVGDFIR